MAIKLATVAGGHDHGARSEPTSGEPELVCALDGVRGGDTEFPVQLVREGGRLALRAINEGGLSPTEIDVEDLLLWLKRLSPAGINVDVIASALARLAARERP